jgi:tRNA G10  N-methylase Trm11
MDRVLLQIEGEQKKVETLFKSFQDVVSVNIKKSGEQLLNVTVESKTDLRKEFARAIIEKKMGLLEMQADKVTLEDIFLHLTTKEEVA